MRLGTTFQFLLHINKFHAFMTQNFQPNTSPWDKKTAANFFNFYSGTRKGSAWRREQGMKKRENQINLLS